MSRSLRATAPADDKILSGEEEETFVCETPGRIFSAPVPSGGGLGNKDRALDWQMGDRPVICEYRVASCHMSHSSTGMINYREAIVTMRMASGRRYPIEGYGDLPLTV